MRSKVLLGTIVAGVIAFPTLAATSDGQPTAQAVSADATSDAADPDERICRTVVPPTGSRLGARRRCGTRAQWSQMDDEGGFARRGIEGIQTQRVCNLDDCR